VRSRLRNGRSQESPGEVTEIARFHALALSVCSRMEEDLEAAKRYRERAEDLRTIAMGTKDAIMRKTF